MQAIAGVHFNYSLPDAFWPVYARDRAQRCGAAGTEVGSLSRPWCATCVAWTGCCCTCSAPRPRCAGASCPAAPRDLTSLARGSYFAPYATSLRMSDIGYKNANQAEIWVSANSLEEYIADLTRAIRTPHPGLRADRRGGGRGVPAAQRQPAADRERVLQHHPAQAIRAEWRAADGRPVPGRCRVRGTARTRPGSFRPGRPRARLRFAEVFLVYCLLADSPPIDRAERREISAQPRPCGPPRPRAGPAPAPPGTPHALRDWAAPILGEMQGVAEMLDAGDGRAGQLACRARRRAPRGSGAHAVGADTARPAVQRASHSASSAWPCRALTGTTSWPCRPEEPALPAARRGSPGVARSAVLDRGARYPELRGVPRRIFFVSPMPRRRLTAVMLCGLPLPV